MAYIRYKTFKNNTYAYEITSIWDANLKQSRNKSRYLGKVDKATKQPIPIIKKPKTSEKLILDFGDGYFIYEFIRKHALYPILKSCLFDKEPALEPLLIYRLCVNSGLNNFKSWLDGNIIRVFFKDINISSQEMIELLKFLGNKQVQHSFFTEYLKLVGRDRSSIIISTTVLFNKAHVGFTNLERLNSKIVKQVKEYKALFVIDRSSEFPLFYRLLSDNVSNVAILKSTVSALENIGVQNYFALLDTDYFSEADIKDLYSAKIDFLVKVPSNRAIFKNLILGQIKNLEQLKSAQFFNGQKFFIKQVIIELYGHTATAYIILDHERKAREMTEFIKLYSEEAIRQDRSQNNHSKLAFASCGISIFISSKPITTAEILTCYNGRKFVELVFQVSENTLNLKTTNLKNNNKSEGSNNDNEHETINGYVFLQFLLFILFIEVKEKTHPGDTVEQVLMILRNLKCKVFDDQIIPQKISKEQGDILQKHGIIVPTVIGIDI